MKPKVFISGGCSYSQLRTRDTSWPVWMVKALNPEKISYSGQGSQGNEFISRSVISAVEIALSEGYDPKDILVGVMWSGCDRMNHYSEDLESNYEKITNIGYGEPDYNNFLLVYKNTYFLVRSDLGGTRALSESVV